MIEIIIPESYEFHQMTKASIEAQARYNQPTMKDLCLELYKTLAK